MNTRALRAAQWVSVLICFALNISRADTRILGPADAAPPPPIERFEPLVPWKGIRNHIFDSFNRVEIRHEPVNCVPEEDIDRFFAKITPRRITEGKRLALGESGEAIWRKMQESHDAGVRNKAIVRRSGVAEAQRRGAKGWRKAGVGDRLGEGDAIRSSGESNADLFLGDNGPVIRVTRNSEVEFVRLRWREGNFGKVINTMIDVRKGRILGNVMKLAPESSYLVRTRGGVIRIKGTEFSISEDGTCQIITGSAEVITGTEAFVVKAGEVYEPRGTKLE